MVNVNIASMKADERQLLVKLVKERPKQSMLGPTAEDVAAELGIHHKRADYLLSKWMHKRWWECGVTARTGWLTEMGLAVAKELLNG